MAKPIPIPVRRKLLERTLAGDSTATLATTFNLPPRTVRHLRQRFRDRGVDAVQPDYRAPKRLRHSFPARVREAALALRREHPTWGAVFIWIALGQQYRKRSRPSPRTLRRWFHDAELGPPPKPQRPCQRTPRATAPHQTWQVDASERITLADGSQVSWLRVVDEATGAVLRTAVFPPGLLVTG
jgi:Homeodomain-like domain